MHASDYMPTVDVGEGEIVAALDIDGYVLLVTANPLEPDHGPAMARSMVTFTLNDGGHEVARLGAATSHVGECLAVAAASARAIVASMTAATAPSSDVIAKLDQMVAFYDANGVADHAAGDYLAELIDHVRKVLPS